MLFDSAIETGSNWVDVMKPLAVHANRWLLDLDIIPLIKIAKHEPVVALGLPSCYGYELGIMGWSQEIGRHSVENEVAIKSVDFSSAKFDAVPYKDDERMVPVPGFNWSNSDNMVAAKDGVFFGFTVDDNPHVYICPLMGGSRGVAWVTDTTRIDEASDVNYEYSGTANWYIWTL